LDLVALNIPFAIVGMFGLKIIGLYLITNLLTTCVVVPLALGMIPALDRYVSGTAALLGSLCGLVALIIFAIVNNANIVGHLDGAVAWEGIVNTFYIVYDWPPFLVALLVSSGATILLAAIEFTYYKLRGIEQPVPAHLFENPKLSSGV
jgi:hypothetical protein